MSLQLIKWDLILEFGLKFWGISSPDNDWSSNSPHHGESPSENSTTQRNTDARSRMNSDHICNPTTSHGQGQAYFLFQKLSLLGTPLVVQWLRLHTPNAGGTGLIPGRATKILHATWRGQKKKKEKKETCWSWFCLLQLKQQHSMANTANLRPLWNGECGTFAWFFPAIHFSSLWEGSTSPPLDIWFAICVQLHHALDIRLGHRTCFGQWKVRSGQKPAPS